MVANSSEPFVVQYNLRWRVVFPIFLSWNLSRKKPCSTSSSEKMCLLCFQLDAGSLWSFKSLESMCIFPHDRGFNYHKAAVLVVVCLLTALINAHIKELKDHANLANTKIIAARFATKKTRKLFIAVSLQVYSKRYQFFSTRWTK